MSEPNERQTSRRATRLSHREAIVGSQKDGRMGMTAESSECPRLQRISFQ